MFAGAMSQEAFHWGELPSTSGPAWRLLLQGWQAIANGYVEWLANPLLLYGWLALARRQDFRAALAGGTANALMLVFLLHGPVRLPGVRNPVHLTPGPGYWLWVGSAALILVASLCGATATRRRG